jgi:hypothetical protein
MPLEKWNVPHLWRDAYDDLTNECLFFAEDIFGNQFAIRDEHVVAFDAETGVIEPIASSMEEWGARMMADWSQLSGFPLAHAWQKLNGPIPEGSRLVPRIPFVMGGAFSIENLHVLDAVRGMRWRGDIAVQIRDLPDGASVNLKIV